MHFTYNMNHKERARKLRASMTPEEQSVWKLVRRKQIHGTRFHRQRPIDQYILDFYCPQAKLAVEIDGEQHSEPNHAEADRVRTDVLNSLGIKVLRFTNREVRRYLPDVAKEIERVVGERIAGS